ncbi:MAG: phosphomannomutase/phosphoglucomutase [Gammaproteobacteria bacterium]|nr:phosphomannomutase/phosphoglucomutase [Gammaproteobacteria bacterium]
MALVGLLCLAASSVLFRSNKQWALEQKIEAAQQARKTASPTDLEADDETPRIAPSEPRAGPVEEVEPAAPGESATPEEGGAPEPPPLTLHYDIAERRRQREAEHAPVELSAEIFRAYDIRGVIDKTLDSGVARSVGQAVGSLALERDAAPVVVARDGRLSGPYLMEGMIAGIVSTGCDVLDIGAVPTGVLYYAAHELAAGSGVMITGSHNPPDYNGFKVMVGGDTMHGDAIKGLYERIASGQLLEGAGQVTKKNVVSDYIERIAADISVEKPLKVVIDCGNGIGGVCAADALRAIGVEVLPLFDEVDGTFPNHHPDPSEPENLTDLIESVRLMDADLGLALDGDADRLGVVTLAGNIIYPDRVMMLLALDVLDRHPGATIIYDVKCTGHLPKVIAEAGGNPVMYKTGHSLIKARMKEIDSPFAGEMSGHFFFGDRWYGVDDGIYAAARLLEILGGTETPPEAILNALPTSYSTPELKVQMSEGENHDFIDAFRLTAKFEGAEVSTIDGLRADYEDGWGLVRASNTTPILVVRFDAETEEALERIKTVFRTQMLQLNSSLELPF